MEGILLVLVMVIVVLAWNRFAKGLDWIGDRVGETTDMLSDITISGAKQTQRGVIISNDSLLDTAAESKEKEVNRLKRRTQFTKGLKDDEREAFEKHEQYLKDLLSRK